MAKKKKKQLDYDPTFSWDQPVEIYNPRTGQMELRANKDLITKGPGPWRLPELESEHYKQVGNLTLPRKTWSSLSSTRGDVRQQIDRRKAEIAAQNPDWSTSAPIPMARPGAHPTLAQSKAEARKRIQAKKGELLDRFTKAIFDLATPDEKQAEMEAAAQVPGDTVATPSGVVSAEGPGEVYKTPDTLKRELEKLKAGGYKEPGKVDATTPELFKRVSDAYQRVVTPDGEIKNIEPEKVDLADAPELFKKITRGYRNVMTPEGDIKDISENIEITKPAVPEPSQEIPESQKERVTQNIEESVKDLAKKEIAEAKEEGRQPASVSNLWHEAILAFAPAVLTTLTGDVDVPSGAIGLKAQKQYKDELKAERARQDKFDLQEMRSRRSAQSANPTKITYVDDQGINRLGYFDPGLKQFYDSRGNPIDQPKAGYAPKLVEHPGTGVKEFINPNDPKTRIVSMQGRFNPKQNKVLDETYERLIKNPNYKESYPRFVQAESVKLLLNAGRLTGNSYLKEYNEIASEAAKVSLARLAGEKGPLSDMDLTRWGGDQAVFSMMDRLYLRITKGQPLRTKDRQNLLQIAEIYEEAMVEKINLALEQEILRGQRQYGPSFLTKDDFYDVLTPYGATASKVKLEKMKEPGDAGKMDKIKSMLKEGEILARDKDGKFHAIEMNEIQEKMQQGWSIYPN